MNYDHKYLKEYNNYNNPNKKITLLNNISTDFSKTTKVLNNNYMNQINAHTNANNHNHNNYLYDKKVFKNTKLYNVIKPTKYIKKRNNSNSSLHNNYVEASLTDGNLNGNNSKKFISIFHSNTFKINNRNLKIQKNPNNMNNNIKLKKTKTHVNTLLHNSNSFKILTKSKSNIGSINLPQYQNYAANNSRNKYAINNNNIKIFSTLGLTNNLSLKNIKNYSRFSQNKKNVINTNINNNNKLSDSIPKRSEDMREKMKGLKKEIENYKKEINNKDQIIKNQDIKIKKLISENENCQKMIKNMHEKYNNLKKDYNIMEKNYVVLKEKIVESEKNIKLMKKKELKLMEVLYLIKEKGIDINSVLNEVSQVTFHEVTSSPSPSDIKNNKNEEYNDNKNNIDNIDNNLIINSIRDNMNNESGISDLTVYFPDKIKMTNIMETKWGKNIPKLNFGYVPEYSDLDSGQQEQKNDDDDYNYNIQMNDDNFFFPKFKKFQNSV